MKNIEQPGSVWYERGYGCGLRHHPVDLHIEMPPEIRDDTDGMIAMVYYLRGYADGIVMAIRRAENDQ